MMTRMHMCCMELKTDYRVIQGRRKRESRQTAVGAASCLNGNLSNTKKTKRENRRVV